MRINSWDLGGFLKVLRILLIILLLVLFDDLKSVIIPFFELVGKLIEKFGLSFLENPLFWMQRHLFEIVENRLKNKVICIINFRPILYF